GSGFVVTRRYAPTVLDLVEEPFDQIPYSIEMRATADRIVAIATRRNVGPCAPLGCKRSDPVRIIDSVGSTAPDCRRDRSLAARRLSCASPAVSATRTGRPFV